MDKYKEIIMLNTNWTIFSFLNLHEKRQRRKNNNNTNLVDKVTLELNEWIQMKFIFAFL